MPQPIFDSRRVNVMSYFSCKLTAGNYVISSTEAPGLTGSLVVAAKGNGDFAAVTFRSDANGELAFLNPPPFNANDASYVTFNYFGDVAAQVAFSVQLAGPLPIDSNGLQQNQLFGYGFFQAGLFSYSAYLLTPPLAGSKAGPSFILQQQGDIMVRDDAPVAAPTVITLNAASGKQAAITVLTGAFVSWQVGSGTWYVTGTAAPPIPG
jgi:hypothetical protein